jgi:aspartyl-tRNA(Asn)/glutamyl-tRNA(Gln) amidotransferase subunit C
MKIDKQTIQRLAELSKLEFDEAESTEMEKDLNNMLAFVEQLKAVDVEGVEPLIFVNESNVNQLRKDEVVASTSQAEALKNAPQKDMYYFRVPKVINQS